MRTSLVMLALALLAACGESDPVPTDPDAAAACVDQPFRAVLHVDANDPRAVWATDFASGRDIAVRARPPERFTVDQSRPTQLLNGEGALVSFDGEISQTGCFDLARQVVYLGPEDLPDPSRPGG